MPKKDFLKVLGNVGFDVCEVNGNFIIEVLDEDDWYNVKRALEKA